MAKGWIRVLRVGLALLSAGLLAACAAVPPVPTLALAQLAPGGTLRAAINYGNPLLATRDANGEPRGVSVDLARELARRLGVPLEPVIYSAAGKVVEGIRAGAWDVGFLAIDPVCVAAAACLREFIKAMKASGFIAESLRRHGMDGAVVANPAGPGS